MTFLRRAFGKKAAAPAPKSSDVVTASTPLISEKDKEQITTSSAASGTTNPDVSISIATGPAAEHKEETPPGYEAPAEPKRESADKKPAEYVDRRSMDFRDEDHAADFSDAIINGVSSVANFMYEKSSKALGELWPLLVRPVLNLPGAFFKDKQGKLNVLQPVKDTLRAGVEFPVMMTADVVAPVNARTGKLWGIPTMTVFGRMAQWAHLVVDAVKGGTKEKPLTKGERIQAGAAAVSSVTNAVLLGFAGVGVATGAINAVSDNPNPEVGFSILPHKVIENIIESNLSALGIFVMSVVGYFSATAGYVIGRESALHQVQDWMRELIADIEKDQLQRAQHYIDKLRRIDKDAADKAEQAYLEAVKAKKVWDKLGYGIDTFGRTLERLTAIPAAVLKSFGYVTDHTTLPRKWHDTADEAVKSGMKIVRTKANNSLAEIKTSLGIKVDAEVKEVKYPEHYAELLEAKQAEYTRPGLAVSGLKGVFKRDGKTAQDRKLFEELESSYLQDVFNYNVEGKRDGITSWNRGFMTDMLLPSKNKLLPFSSEWKKQAVMDPNIQDMLEGKFPEGVSDMKQRLALYFQLKYLYFSGQQAKIAQIPGMQVVPQYEAPAASAPAQDLVSGAKNSGPLLRGSYVTPPSSPKPTTASSVSSASADATSGAVKRVSALQKLSLNAASGTVPGSSVTPKDEHTPVLRKTRSGSTMV